MKYLNSIFLGLVLILSGCAPSYLDKEWEFTKNAEAENKKQSERLELLQLRCDLLNANINALADIVSVLSTEDYVTSVSDYLEGETVVGKKITFLKSGPVIILNGKDGKDGRIAEDGKIPVVGAAQDLDGAYYWTLNGEFITDIEGVKRPCTGEDALAPEFRIQDGQWEISYDNGQSWEIIGAADGQNSDLVFADVIVNGDCIMFTMADGSTISLAKYKKLGIELDIEDGEADIEDGKSVFITYKLSNITESTVVTAATDGNYKIAKKMLSDSTGLFVITCPTVYKDGFVTVTAYDGLGYSQTRLINFYKREILFPEGFEFTIPEDGGTVSIPVSSNFNYSLKVDEEAENWVKVLPETRAAMSDKTLNIKVDANSSLDERIARVNLYAQNNYNSPQSVILITQSPALLLLERKQFVLSSQEQRVSSSLHSSQEPVITTSEGSDWLKVDYWQADASNYSFAVKVKENGESTSRRSTVYFINPENNEPVDSVSVIQLTADDRDPADLVFKVSISEENDRTVYLPLKGTVDGFIDWGDGSPAETVSGYYSNEDWIWHKYDTSEQNEYFVSISGSVNSLSSYNIPSHSITSVIQWGNVGLRRMDNAFDSNELLLSIAGDSNHSLAEVRDLSRAFRNCTNLTEIPEGLFTSCRKVESFNDVFSGCISLTAIPENLFEGLTFAKSFKGVFSYCKQITSIPEGIFAGLRNAVDFSFAFSGCSALSVVPATLFSDSPKAKTFKGCFLDCRSLTQIAAEFFDENRKVENFSQCFAHTRLLCESPYTIIKGKKCHLYERVDYPYLFTTPAGEECFYDVEGLIDLYMVTESWK